MDPGLGSDDFGSSFGGNRAKPAPILPPLLHRMMVAGLCLIVVIGAAWALWDAVAGWWPGQ